MSLSAVNQKLEPQGSIWAKEQENMNVWRKKAEWKLKRVRNSSNQKSLWAGTLNFIILNVTWREFSNKQFSLYILEGTDHFSSLHCPQLYTLCEKYKQNIHMQPHIWKAYVLCSELS